MSEEDDPQKVGFKRPPKSGQFKRGQSGNPRGSRKHDDWDVAAILDEEVKVRVGARMVKMSGFEFTARGLIRRALQDKNLPATIDFIRMCEKYKAIEPPAAIRRSSTILIPWGWDLEEFMAMLKKHGAPPWPGPRSGLTKADQQRVLEFLKADEEKKKKKKKEPGPRPRSVILKDLLDEMHSVQENGRQRRRSTRYLILRALRSHSFSKTRAARVVEDLLERYGRSELKPAGGLVILTEPPSTPEEIEQYNKMADEQQRQFREADCSKPGKYEK
jgi:hypothetical protein